MLAVADEALAAMDDASYNYFCQAEDCGDGQRLLETGKCASCPAYTRPQQNGRICAADTCFGGSSFVNEDGRCGTCNPYERYDEQQRQCISATCFG